MNSFYGPYYSAKEATTTNTFEDDIMPVEVEESTGFHVFELHAPTAGVSILTLVVALIAIALAYGTNGTSAPAGATCGPTSAGCRQFTAEFK